MRIHPVGAELFHADGQDDNKSLYPQSERAQNASLRPFNEQQHKNCSTTLNGLPSLPHDVQAPEEGGGEEKQVPNTMFLQIKENIKKYKNFLAW